MRKQEFFRKIKLRLSQFDESEVKRIINYYDEIIIEKMEEGISEEEAINDFGSIDNIINDIKIDLVSKRTSIDNKHAMKNFMIILGICSTPILLPLAITFAVLFFTMFIVLFVLIFSFFVSGISVIIGVSYQSYLSLLAGNDIAYILIQLGAAFMIGGILIYLSIMLTTLTKVLLTKTNKRFTKLVKNKTKRGNEQYV